MEGANSIALADIQKMQLGFIGTITSKKLAVQLGLKQPAASMALQRTLDDIKKVVDDSLQILATVLQTQSQVKTPIVDSSILELIEVNRGIISHRIEEELKKIKDKSEPYDDHVIHEQSFGIMAPLRKGNELPKPPARKVTWQEDALRVEQELLCQEETDACKDFNQLLKDLSVLTKSENFKRSPQIFISYAWPILSRSYESWVQPFLLNLVDHLNLAGALAMIDLIDSKMGRNTLDHMSRIRDVDFIILIGTESLKDKSGPEAGPRNVQIELNLIIERLAKAKETTANMDGLKNPVIPLLISGTIDSAFPPNIKTYTAVESMIDRGGPLSSYLIELKRLMERIFSVPSDEKNQGRVAWDKLWSTFTKKNDVLLKGLEESVTRDYVEKQEAPLKKDLEESHKEKTAEVLKRFFASKKK